MNPIRVRNAVLFLFLLSAFGGTASYLWEYFGAIPCILCKTERTIILVAMAAFFLGWLLQLGGGLSKLKAFLTFFCFLGTASWLAVAGTFFYHMGIQLKWFALPKICRAQINFSNSVEEMERLLMSQPQGRCDQVEFTVFGLPPTFYFFIGACFVCIMCLYTLALLRRKNRGVSFS
jgi:disulfide bond formation protein DsbB